jgi:hypothetical protein
MADGNYLYLSASWADVTENILKKQWSFDGSTWSQSGDDEDRIAFVWDMGLNGSEGANCVTMCHSPLMHTQNGNVDVWHWKAARGNAIGVADDKYWDTNDRQSDPGTSAYSNNSSMGSGFPSFMATGAPGVNTDFLVNDQNALNAFDPFGTVLPAHTVEVAVPFDSTASFASGDFMAAYLHRVPSGDRASVQTAGKYDSGVWTVSDFDFQVVPGSSVEFTHEIFDNEGGSASGHGAFDPTVYALDLTQVFVGIEENFSDNIIADYYLEQNYPNPFNPTTTIAFGLPRESEVTLKIFNILGKEVTTLVSDFLSAGSYSYEWNASRLASGVYLYILHAGEHVETRKMVLMK